MRGTLQKVKKELAMRRASKKPERKKNQEGRYKKSKKQLASRRGEKSRRGITITWAGTECTNGIKITGAGGFL
jgi:hypothetical protein